ncbi:unnamed protein product [Urochloa decumbens]|uniref:VQ domain-containing protein n=1 Tax=Urochloa decumbens TaxID=240449 RepID=A0ABC9ADK5_9POAL
MANLFAGLDPTWAHLPAPAPTHSAAAGHCCFFPAAAFENEALTSALRASMAPAHGSAPAAARSFSSPATPSSSTTSSASELLSSGHDAPAPASRPAVAAARPPARALKGPKGGVTKRKPRPSRRAQTTYIAADPANFRRMVQEITGLPVPGPAAASTPSWTPVPVPVPVPAPAPAFVLPTLDTSAFLLDGATAAPATVPEAKCSSGSAPAAAAVAAAGDHDSSALLEMEAMIDFPFPTLESWGFI